MGTQQFCLRWNNHHTNMLSVFDKLLVKESFVDVTIACEGSNIKAHKIVLSACSPFFEDLFHDNPCKHPIVIMKDMKFNDLKAIIEFMYKGEVNVSQDKLAALLRAAESLKIKGLTEMLGDHPPDSDLNNSSNFQLPPVLQSPFEGNPLTYSKSPSSKRKRHKHNGENKPLLACHKSKSPSPDVEEIQKSPSDKELILPSDSGPSEKLQMDTENNHSSPPLENSNEQNQPVLDLDPSSFMQQSLTENQAFEDEQRQVEFVNHRDHGDSPNTNEASKIESNSSHPLTNSSNNIKSEKKDGTNESLYSDDITHILPQPKLELMDRGVTVIPVSDGVSLSSSSDGVAVSERFNPSNANDDLDHSAPSRGQYSPAKESDSIAAYSPVAIDSYAVTHPTEHLPQSASGHSENIEVIAGTSGEQISPGRTLGSGARFHASIIANILFRVNGTVCPLCTRNFSSRMSLVRHLRCIHTDLDSIQRHECHLCHKNYVRKDKLHDHLASVHQIPPPGKAHKY